MLFIFPSQNSLYFLCDQGRKKNDIAYFQVHFSFGLGWENKWIDLTTWKTSWNRQCYLNSQVSWSLEATIHHLHIDRWSSGLRPRAASSKITRGTCPTARLPTLCRENLSHATGTVVTSTTTASGTTWWTPGQQGGTTAPWLQKTTDTQRYTSFIITIALHSDCHNVWLINQIHKGSQNETRLRGAANKAHWI